MINIRSILKLQNNDGLTLKKGKAITYKSGWQVATEGVECKTAREAINAVKAYNGNCGVWFADGIYYIDKSHRVNTKKEAIHGDRKSLQADFRTELEKHEPCILLRLKIFLKKYLTNRPGYAIL